MRTAYLKKRQVRRKRLDDRGRRLGVGLCSNLKGAQQHGYPAPPSRLSPLPCRSPGASWRWAAGVTLRFFVAGRVLVLAGPASASQSRSLGPASSSETSSAGSEGSLRRAYGFTVISIDPFDNKRGI